MFDNGRQQSDSNGSSSSSNDPVEMERIREWMDRQDWDILDESAEIRRDQDICIQLLLNNRITSDSDFELNASAADLSLASSDLTSIAEEPDPLNQESHPSNVQTTHESAPDGASLYSNDKLRFSSPQILGVGAFGIVFSVHDERLGIEVAIKILRPSKSRSPESRARFIGEARSTASLCHASIVRVYDTGQIAGLPYITSSKMDNGTLADRIAQSKTLPIRQAAWIVARIADSVQFAHSKAILHRDLKPSNILLKPCELDRSEQFGFEPILTDFGLAKRLDLQGSSANQTLDGRVLGTVRYMSPEQAKGAHAEVGTASDIFSLGIILYQLLIGKVPFDNPFDQTIRTMIAEKEPIRPRLVDRRIPADLEAIVLKCLEKEPSNRYQSANELHLDLERFLRGEPVEAKKSTVFRRLLYLSKKHPVVSGLLTVAFLVNCIALVGLTVSLLKERAAKMRERDALIALVSFYTKFGDDIFAGKRVKDSVMLDLCESMLAVLEPYHAENPTDDTILHRISVLKHYQSMALQRTGTTEQYVSARLKVLEILARLVTSHPENEKYRFQQFHSRLLVGDWLMGNPELEKTTKPLKGRDLLLSAIEDIEWLSKKFPEDIDYADALAATKMSLARNLLVEGPASGKELMRQAITISEELWQKHPDRPVLAKHAISGYSRLALSALEESKNELALELILQADDLRERAWGAVKDESWVSIECYRLWVFMLDILIANEKYEMAADRFQEIDHSYAITVTELPPSTETLIGQVRVLSRFHTVFCKTNREQEALAVENKIRQVIDIVKTKPDGEELLKSALSYLGLPDKIRSQMQD
jgi:tRNA A-37 threonylcarbamoyl transferase component Bud32